MERTINHALMLGMVLVGSLLLTSCTPPVYHHAFVTKYDADGNVVGYEETESITQQSPSGSSMKVRINRRDKIED